MVKRARAVPFAVAIFFAAALVLYGVWTTTLSEKMMLFFSPSAERAFEHGSRHIDATNSPKAYDIKIAEYFFEKANRFDPEYPYLQHQRARIAFLNGDFKTAMLRIDQEIEMYGAEHPNSYYVRGLIEGFASDYQNAALDYARYLSSDPTNWAAINDYAWVLLKDGRAREAIVATARGLSFFPDNPWLLNTNAIALYEIELVEPALEQARKAETAAHDVSEYDWLMAYPGNEPRSAGSGIATLHKSTHDNIHTLELALQKKSIQ